MKPLFIPLKSAYFDAFANGSKDTEYRPLGPRWNGAVCARGRAVTLSRGYGKRHRLYGYIERFYVEQNHEKVPGWVECYGDRVAHVACIQIRLHSPTGDKP